MVYGDETVALPPTSDAATRAQLAVVTGLWTQFRQRLEALQTAELESAAFAQAVAGVESLSPGLLQEMDRAVQLYERAAESKLARLRAIQAVFAAGAVGLLIAGYSLTQRTIVYPVSTLEAATRRIANGDLESAVEVLPAASSELRALASSFEHMRHQLGDSRLELERWADELESRVERRTRQLAALLEVSAEISSQLEIQHVLDLIVEQTRQLAGGEIAVLCLPHQTRDKMTVAAISGAVQASVGDVHTMLQGLTPDRACTGEAAMAHEDRDCPLLPPELRRSHVAVPLHAGDRALGVLCVGHREEERFGAEETRLLTLLANAGAIALENARLYKQAEQAATLAERERIVAEIHDGLAQTLGFLGMRLATVRGLIANEALAELPEHLALMQQTIKQANQEARRLMAGLQARPQGQRTLDEVLGLLIERFAGERGIEVVLRIETEQPIWEPPEVHEQVVRVMLEALTTVHKHARSGRAAVTLEQSGGQTVVSVRDDGPGFDVEARSGEGHHFGLKVMETRAKRIGGELSVESVLGQGTTVTLRWPSAGG